ncbi:MAG: hypothetical protein ACRDRJ_21910 [Streptosporangiaceae bacterium]
MSPPTAALAGRIAEAVADPGSVAGPRHGSPAGRAHTASEETAAQWAARAVVEVLREALAIQPCHITGEHEPDHHLRYLCRDQQAAMLSGLLAGLGLAFGDLPRRLHDGCGWCHRIPAQERYRERLRATWAWAGADMPAELAEPALDAPRAGDGDLAAACLTAEWQWWPDVVQQVQETTLMPAERVSAALDTLTAARIAEERRSGAGTPQIRLAARSGETG